MPRPVVIAAFRSADEADQSREELAESDIHADVVPRNVELERLCADVFADGFDVVVDEADAQAAIAIVQRLWREAPVDIVPPPRCPECGSEAIQAIPRLSIFVAAAIVLLATGVLVDQQELFSLVIVILALVLLIAPNRRCRACGARWTARRSQAS